MRRNDLRSPWRSNEWVRAIVCLVTLASFAIPSALEAEGRWIDLRCGQLLDVENRVSLSDQHVLIRDDLIAEIGHRVDAPAEAVQIDLSDRTCMPGLMDVHVHLFIDSTGRTIDESAPTQSSAYNALIGLRNARTLLRSGQSRWRNGLE